MLRLLALLALLQTPLSPPTLVDRLTSAEASRDSAATTAALTQLTDILPTVPVETIRLAIPAIVQAVGDSDPHLRSLAMLALTAITARPTPPDALTLLEPYLPAIASHLSDPSVPVRQLTTLVLGGFLNHPIPAVIGPLLTSLTTADRPADFHLGVVYALLTLGVDSPAHPEIAPAILHFLQRPNLPPALAVRLLNAVANYETHSQLLDTGLLTFLDPTQPVATRTALILLLPRLRLAQWDVDATRARLNHLAAGTEPDQNLKSAATAILTCWHTPRPADPCPAPPVRYRMAPHTNPLTPPKYQTPPLH